MRKKRIQTTEEIRNRLIKRLWPNGNVPNEVANILEDDIVIITEKIAKAHAKDLIKEFVLFTV